MRALDDQKHRSCSREEWRFPGLELKEGVDHTQGGPASCPFVYCHFHGCGPMTSSLQKQVSGLIGPIGHSLLTEKTIMGQRLHTSVT